MNGFQLMMIRKGTKPKLWKRMYVPGGITFTQLSFILDEMYRLSQNERFAFEFHSCRAVVREKGSAYHFKRMKQDYVRFDADATYIDDFLGTQPWFSYYRETDTEETAFRVEIEESIVSSVSDFPELIKSVTLRSDDHSYWEEFNEMLSDQYRIVYEDHPKQLTHKELRKLLEEGRPMTGSRHPVNTLPEGADASSIVMSRIMEKRAWIRKCEYVVTKLYGTCRDSEFHVLCKAAADLELDDAQIEALFDEIPEEERYCVRIGNRYIRQEIAGKESYRNLREWHSGKTIRYPQPQEIETLWAKGYPAEDPVYVMAKNALIDDLGARKFDADEYLRIIFDEFSYGGSIADVVRELETEGLSLKAKEDVQTLTALLVMLNNHSKMAVNKGNAPADLKPAGAGPAWDELAGRMKGQEQSRPVKKAAPKIYPNSPCPCGSGKKYKKCCGRK